MRGNIIEELYYGNIDPQDRGYHPKCPVKKASNSLNDLEEKLTEQLSGDNKELFLRFCNAYPCNKSSISALSIIFERCSISSLTTFWCCKN